MGKPAVRTNALETLTSSELQFDSNDDPNLIDSPMSKAEIGWAKSTSFDHPTTSAPGLLLSIVETQPKCHPSLSRRRMMAKFKNQRRRCRDWTKLAENERRR